MNTSFPACMYVCAGTYPAKSRFNVSVDTIPPAQSNLSSTSHIRPTGNYPPQPVLCVQWHRPKSSASYVLHRSASAFSRPANCAIDAARLYIKALGSAREIRSDTPGPISWFSLSLSLSFAGCCTQCTLDRFRKGYALVFHTVSRDTYRERDTGERSSKSRTHYYCIGDAAPRMRVCSLVHMMISPWRNEIKNRRKFVPVKG